MSHAFSCPHGAHFPILHHDDVKNLTARLLSKVCHDVQVEPHLQPLSGEVLCHHSAVVEDYAIKWIPEPLASGNVHIIRPLLM